MAQFNFYCTRACYGNFCEPSFEDMLWYSYLLLLSESAFSFKWSKYFMRRNELCGGQAFVTSIKWTVENIKEKAMIVTDFLSSFMWWTCRLMSPYFRQVTENLFRFLLELVTRMHYFYWVVGRKFYIIFLQISCYNVQSLLCVPPDVA